MTLCSIALLPFACGAKRRRRAIFLARLQGGDCLELPLLQFGACTRFAPRAILSPNSYLLTPNSCLLFEAVEPLSMGFGDVGELVDELAGFGELRAGFGETVRGLLLQVFVEGGKEFQGLGERFQAFVDGHSGCPLSGYPMREVNAEAR